jgi:hypothetical protein
MRSRSRANGLAAKPTPKAVRCPTSVKVGVTTTLAAAASNAAA